MKSDQNKKETIANAEYDRLVKLFTDAGVDKIKVEIYSELIRKVAEVFACLEVIKDLPSILYDKNNPTVQRETAAGKMRVKYMAQHTCNAKVKQRFARRAKWRRRRRLIRLRIIFRRRTISPSGRLQTPILRLSKVGNVYATI